jgi:hypothetical protein
MGLQYNDAQRREYLHMIDNVGQRWLKVFDNDTGFYSAVYWDLLTRIWKAERPVRRTDALKFLTSVKSPATAGKYIDGALQQGLLRETSNPQDARSKLLELSPNMRARLDAFFDEAVSEVRHAYAAIGRKGPLP